MQCVIFAAGEGIRMRPLTINTPKPLIKVGGKPLLLRIAQALPEQIDELIIVIGYLGDQIREFCGEYFLGRPVKYVWQKKKLGTADALLRAKTYLSGDKFLVLNGDDIIGKQSLQECMQYQKALIVAEHEDPKRFGVVRLRDDGTVAEVIEKPENPKSNLVSTGAMLLDFNIFKHKPVKHPNGEYYLADMFDKLIKSGEKVIAVKTADWFPLATCEDIKAAELWLQKKNIK